jgi:hypothetical protein
MIKYEVPHTIFSARLRRLLPLILVLISAAIAVAGYLQALNYPFISDDIRYITENTKLAELPLPQLWRLFTEPYNAFAEFLPLRDLTYWLELTLFGLNPTAFRMTNIVLYLLCLPLVFATTLEFWRYFRPTDTPSAPWAAAVVTALFALHPTLVESVVWISGLKYVLPNLFAMLALWFAVRARNAQGLSASRAAAALVAFVAMMLSKASYFALAPVIAMLWVIFWLDIKAPGRRRSQLLWPLTILILAGLLVLVFISASIGTEPAYFGIEAGLRTLVGVDGPSCSQPGKPPFSLPGIRRSEPTRDGRPWWSNSGDYRNRCGDVPAPTVDRGVFLDCFLDALHPLHATGPLCCAITCFRPLFISCPMASYVAHRRAGVATEPCTSCNLAARFCITT